MNKKERIDKILSNQGFGSRSFVKSLIKDGKVSVDGVTVKNSSEHYNTTQNIYVNGKKLIYSEFLYIMMNKPGGVLSATTDEKERTVIDLLPKELKRKNLFPAGRLDKDTEGLLIITDDGDLAHKMLSPKNHIPKSYFAKIDGFVTDNDALAFSKPMDLGDFITKPAKLEILKSDEISEILITISEGKYHQVKRMFLKVGKEVVYLKRIKMGALSLDETLEKGQARLIDENEKKLLLEGKL